MDELFASFSRPYIAISCGTAVAGSCFIQASAPIAIPVAGAVVGAYMAARTMDKNIAAKAASADKRSDTITDVASKPGADVTVAGKVEP